MSVASDQDPALRKAVTIVALLNLAYFGIEFAVATFIGSVSLFADSVDFLEDTSVNILIAVAIRWSARSRARVGMLLAAILMIPGVATVWTAWQKIQMPVPPEPVIALRDRVRCHGDQSDLRAAPEQVPLS